MLCYSHRASRLGIERHRYYVIQSFFDMQAPRQPHVFLSFFFSFCLFGDVAFSEFIFIFCTIAAFSLYGEYVVRSFLPNGVSLPCDHGLDFLHQLM